MMLGLVVSTPSFAQELMLPSDPLAGRVIESTASPVQSTAGSRLSSAPMSADSSMMGTGPISANSSGSYYNPLLGSHIRARYTTQSYGQQAGTLDLGTMKLMPLEGGMAFLDGQVTLNDESHVGYNLGAGYRWMTLPLFPFSPDDRKIMGVSVWSDGGSKGGSNFFPQIGTSLEFLGDRIDFRANGYAPIGNRTQTRDFTPTTAEGFTENGIGLLLQGVEDTALTVGEAEVAGRIGDLDAWAFAGVYGMRGGIYEATGGKLGLRGYVTPDLFLSVAVANDDEFDTNTLVNLTWFIGRTRAENCPTGVLEDRLREPVLRNNYVASQERAVTRVGDVARSTDGSALRIIHIDSTAANGGNGTFESPFNSLDDITDASTLANDTILFHGGSDFNNQQAVLLDGQIAIGEGGNFVSTIDTFELGTINLPETAAGAQSGARPTIDGGAGAGIVLADGNTIQNLEFDGGVNAIVNEANGSNGATLNNLSIANTTGDGISLTAFFGADADDIDGDGDTTEDLNVLGAVAISEVTFDGVGGNDIDIDASVGALATANIIAEAISITGVTSDNNTTAESIAIRNTTSNGSVTISDFTYNGGATGQGGLLVEQTSGTVALSDSTFNGGATAAATFTEASGNIGVADITYNGGTTSTGGLVFDRTTGAVTNTGSTFNDGIGVAVTATGDNGTGGTVAISTMTYNGGTTSLGGVLYDQTTGATALSNSTFNDGTGVAVTATQTAGNHTISDLTYDGGTTATGGVSLDRTTGDVTIDTASFTDGVGVAIAASEALGAVDIDGVTYEGGTTATGALNLTQTTGDVTVDTSTFNEGIGPAVQITQTEGPISIGATVDITEVSGKSVVINAPAGTVPNTVAIGANISNTMVDGGGVTIDGNEAIVNFTGNITTLNDQSVVITDSQANITFSGDVDDVGSGDAITITDAGSNTADVAEVSFTGDITNDNNTGRSIVIIDGDDDILFGGNLTDNGDGVVITTRAAGSEVTFGTPTTNMTINSETSNGITMTGNNATSVVTILADLDITTTSGTGIQSSNGRLDISNADNSITTDTGRALDITAGSSTTGVRFGEVNVGDATNKPDNAVVLQDFDGTVTINSGELNSSLNAVLLNNSSLVMNDVQINSDLSIVAIANFSDALNHTLSLSNLDANNGTNDSIVTVNSSDDGNGTLTLSEVTGLAEITFNDTGDGNGTATLTNVTSSAGVNFDAGGDGTAALTVSGGSYETNIDALANNTGNFTANVVGNTELASTSDINIDAQNEGTFTTTVAGVTDGSSGPINELDIDTNSDVTDTSISVTGGEYANVAIDSLNTGTLDVTLNGVTNDSALTVVNSAAATDTTLFVINGEHDGITFNSLNSGTLAVNIDDVDSTGSAITISNTDAAGNTTVDVVDGRNSGVTITAANTGTLDTRVNNVTATGLVDVSATSDVTTASYEFTGGTNTGLTLSTDNGQAVSGSVTNVESTGALSITTTNGSGGADLSISGGKFDGGIFVDADTVGIIDYTMTGVAIDTLANVTAVDLDFGSSITSGNVDIMNNDGFNTLDALAMDIAFTGGATGINFRLASNDFSNNSATDQTVLITASGTANVNATVTGNTALNSNAVPAVEFEIATLAAGSPAINLNLIDNTATSSGGPVGSGDILIRESGGTFRVFELNDTFNNVGNRNNATVTFDPNNVANFDNLATEPATP